MRFETRNSYVKFPTRLVIASFLILAEINPARAVPPLITDDADTVEPGQWQINTGSLFVRTASEQLFLFPVNLVTGLSSRGEVGVTLGYQVRDGTGSAPEKGDATGVTDLFLETKWRLWQAEDEKFKVSTRLDLKLPTASRSRGFGTGDLDAGVVLIATRSWGKTEIDWNLGYIAVDPSRGLARDDRWFFGQALRQKLNDRWTFISETFAIVPNTGAGGSSNFHFNAGAQFTIRENLIIWALLGSAAGHHSPDLTSFFGMTVVF
jgi:hypothetical protein